MSMSDGVLAAIIAASATVFTAFVQLKAAFAKEVQARAQAPYSRRKNRMPLILLIVILGAAGVAGFALSQWITEHQRAAQNAVQAELRARIEQMSRTESQLASTHAEISANIRRNIGLEGVVVMATVGPCRPALVVSTPALSAIPAGGAPQPQEQPAATSSPSTCTESEAVSVTLCATIPANATLTELALYVRPIGSDEPWANSQVMPGHEVDQARFAEAPVEIAETATTKQICEGFAHWSTDRGRVVRMVTRYTL
jgi:hypothetical protein